MASRSMKNGPNVKKKRPLAGVLSVFAVLFGIVIACGVGICALASLWLQDLPDYKNAASYNTAFNG